jgi:hypothetical protein
MERKEGWGNYKLEVMHVQGLLKKLKINEFRMKIFCK